MVLYQEGSEEMNGVTPQTGSIKLSMKILCGISLKIILFFGLFIFGSKIGRSLRIRL